MGFLDVYSIIAILVVITIHESAHAWSANYLGDPTAKLAGRVSFNPLAHLDLVGSLMFYFFGIGWGKPVPVNPYNLKNPRKDNALVALAGPASNFFTALIFALPYKYLQIYGGGALTPLNIIVERVFDFSLFLMIFNLLPIPPLDGSKVLMLILPQRFYRKYDKYLEGGMMYFIAFILIDQFVFARLFGFSVLGFVIGNVYLGFKYVLLLGS